MGGGEQQNVSIKKKKNGSYKSIFMHADALDWFLMAFGSFGAIGAGAATQAVVRARSIIFAH